MNSEFIKERELKNDNRHVYLYHLEEEHSIWIAYGYSAYSLKLFAMSHGVEYVRGLFFQCSTSLYNRNKGRHEETQVIPSCHSRRGKLPLSRYEKII